MGDRRRQWQLWEKSEMTHKRMKVKYLKIRFLVPDLPLVHQSVDRNQVPRLDCLRRLLKQHES
jgi:hypothetical protein